MTEFSPQPALEIRDLAKSFDRPAVDGLSLRVRAGEFYTLLGPNGAGKTTTLRMTTGLLKPDRGMISVFGADVLADPVAAKQIMAWVSDEPMIYDRLTPLEYLYFVAGRGASTTPRPKRGRVSLSHGSGSPRTRRSAAKASPKARARRWRWPAHWCTSRG
jgi:ABC-type multidrug transport system ATPase subunit